MVTIVLVPTQTGELSNEASVSGNELEANLINNRAAAKTFVYVAAPVVQIRRLGNQVNISWTPPGGALQDADSITGPWYDVANASNPVTLNATARRKFYRVLLE